MELPLDPLQLILCLHIVILMLLNGRIYELVQRVRLKKMERAAGVGAGGELSQKHEWQPAGAHGDGNLLAYIALHDGLFAMRLVIAEIPAGIAELMCLPREIDLMPSWNIFCSWGGLLRLNTPTDLVAGGVLSLPWPVPRHSVMLHAHVQDRMATMGCVLVDAADAHASFEGEKPAELASCPHMLPIQGGIAHLKPLPPSQDGAPRSAVDFVVEVDLKRMTMLGGALAANMPQWLIAMVMTVVVPWVYRKALGVLRDQVAKPTTALGARMAKDETGVYRDIRRWAGQAPPPVS